MKAAKDVYQNIMQAVVFTKSKNVESELEIREGLYRFVAEEDVTIKHSRIAGDGVLLPAGVVEYFYMPNGTIKVSGEVNIMGDYE